MKDSGRFIDKYLNEIIDYGGEPCTRAEVILDMQARGIDQPCIDRWLQGYGHAQSRRERHHALTVRLHLTKTYPSAPPASPCLPTRQKPEILSSPSSP